ncbi:MAG TPA: FIST N-terminal domain-containing protein [Mycobacteriales bacterium]|jgi:small ligand-binding sensory domain FIST|nr:FIST N-terminal domain-containing protein [Mycobacteriales bacterium]
MGRFGSGLASGADLVRAAEEATAAALAPLGGIAPTLVCAFVCGPDPASVEAAFARVSSLVGDATTLGCSAGGVIGAERAVEAVSAVSVWAAVLPAASIRTFHLEVMRTPESLAVIGLPERAGEADLCLLLADPYSFPADGFVSRFNDTAAGLPVAGGLASGMLGPGGTRLLVDGRVVDRGAVGALLAGDVTTATIVSQGCRPIGPTMIVTRSEGNVVLELAGTPALRKLEEIVAELPADEQALASRGLQLGIAMDEYAEVHDRGDFLIRGVLGTDDDRGGLVVGDLVEVGRTVRFQVRDAQAAADDLRELLAGPAALGGPGLVEGALLFSCNGRGAALFPSADHDAVTVAEHFAHAPVAGFFAAGEIGPVGGRNYLHGFTASIVAFG